MRQREESHASRQSPFLAEPVTARDTTTFVEKVKGRFGIMVGYREVAEMAGAHTVREPHGAYALDSSREIAALTQDDTVLWQKSAKTIETWRGPTRKTLVEPFKKIILPVATAELRRLLDLKQSGLNRLAMLECSLPTQFPMRSNLVECLAQTIQEMDRGCKPR